MVKNFLKISVVILLLSYFAFAQHTIVSATITDNTGQLWTFGNYSVDFIRNPSFSGTVPLLNGTPFQEHGITGSLNTVAFFTVTLADVLQVSPSGGQWQFTICPNASAPCSTVGTANLVTGASTNLSAFLSTNVTPPQVNTTNINRAYKDTEVTQTQGGFYYDVTLNCMKFGNGSLFSCVGSGGGGGTPGTPANSIQGNSAGSFAGISNTFVNFATGQTDIQNASGVRNATPTAKYNWSQSGAANTILTAGSAATITLTPCPIGVDTSAVIPLGGPHGAYPVAIVDGTNTESAYVSGGTCTSGAVSGTIVFTPFFSHTAAAYTLQSATAGAQEAVNDGCSIIAPASGNAGQCHIVISPIGGISSGFGSAPIWLDTLYFHAWNSTLDGGGVIIDCEGRGPCLQNGNLSSSSRFNGNTINGLTFATKTNAIYNSCSISNTVRTSNVVTITLASACSQLRTGDRVTIILTDDMRFRGDVPSITVIDSTHFTYPTKTLADIPTHASLGFVALTHVAVLDAATGTTINDIKGTGLNGGLWANFFDLWDDENLQINGYNNEAIGPMNTPTWAGFAIYSGGAGNLPNSYNMAPVVAIKSMNLTNSPGLWIEDSNGIYVRDSVMQNSYIQAHVSNLAGNFQGAYFENIYSETNGAIANGAGGSPWQGTGAAGLNGGQTSGQYEYRGNQAFSPRGTTFTTVGSGGTCFTYYIVVHDTTGGTVTLPVPLMYACQNSASTPTVSWPRIVNGADTITYDGLRCPGQLDSIGIFPSFGPYVGGTPGGATNVCGSIFTGQAQQNSFVQTFTDNTATNTTSYTITYPPTLDPIFDFWPGQVVVAQTPLLSTFEQAVSGFYLFGPSNIADYCFGINIGPGGYSTCLASAIPPNNAIQNQGALLLSDGVDHGGGGIQSKGRLNFTHTPGSSWNARHMITLADSNAAKTQATGGYRPLADALDTYIGFDNAGGFNVNAAQLAFGAPAVISQYIGNIGDNTSWKTRLTASGFTIAVPVTLSGITGSTQCLHVSSTGLISGFGADCATGGTTSGSLTTGFLPKASGASSIVNSAVDDGITTANTLTYTGTAGVSATKYTATGAGAGTVTLGEGAAPSAAASFDICYADSVQHAILCSYNNGTFFVLPQIIKATSSAFATATTAGTCVQNTTAVTGAATSMTVSVSPVSTPGVGAVWSGFVSSAGNITINECAVATSAGGSIAFNIRVTP
jgi:hypothetical protein